MRKVLPVIIYVAIIMSLTILYKSEDKILAAIVVYIGMSGGYFVLYVLAALVDTLFFKKQCMKDVIIIGAIVLTLQVLHDIYIYPVSFGYSLVGFIIRVGQSLSGYCFGKFLGWKLNMRKKV